MSTAFRPEDIGSLVAAESVRLSPDGSRFVYVVSSVDLPGNTYRRSLWTGDTGTPGSERPLTSGDLNDTQPVWSPDGARIAFVRTGPAEGRQGRFTLHVAPVDGPGEIVTVCGRGEGFEGLSWSPDGRRLLFAARVPLPTGGRSRPARRITGLGAKLDNVGWTVDRPRQIFVVDAAARAVPRQLTVGAQESYDAAWSRDGSRIAYVSARHEDADLDKVSDVWLQELGPDAGEAVRVTSSDAVFRCPSWGQGDAVLAFYQSGGPDGRRMGFRHNALAIHDLRSDERTVLSAELDRTLLGAGARSPIWDGDALIVASEDHGDVPLLRIGLDGTVERLLPEHQVVTSYDVSGDGSRGVATVTTLEHGPEVFALTDAEPARLTNHQPDRKSFAVERLAVPSEDGTVLDGWLLLPPGTDARDASRRIPVLLSVHGGPATQYTNAWHDEFALLVGAGFAVVYTNPHGSTGHTEAFARAIMSPYADTPGTGWGQLDYRDLLAVLDAVLEAFPALDRERQGVLGGSYGGYMTSWMVSHTDRFSAACSERAANNIVSLDWSSDVGGRFYMNHGADTMRYAKEVYEMSPVAHVENIHTPLLILHSDGDLRCPPEQGDALFVPLRRLGRTVEYWRFPDEGHEMSRTGTPEHRVQRAELINEWFTRWLRPEPATNAGPRNEGENVR